MPIVNRRRLLATFGLVDCRRRPRATLRQPRRRPAGGHARRAVRRRVGGFRHGLGARRPAVADAGRGVDHRQLHDDPRRRFRRCAAGERFHRQGAAGKPAAGAGHLLPRPLCGSVVADRSLGEPVTGRFRTAPADRRSVSFVWSGDTAGQGWGIDEARGGMRTYATMQKNRPDFFIHSGDTIYADVPIAARGEAAGRHALEKSRHRGEVEARRDARRVSRQFQIQPARPESSRLQRRGPDVRAVGRSRGQQQLVAGRGSHRRKAPPARLSRDQRNACCCSARAARFTNTCRSVRSRPRPAASIARFPMVRCSTCSCSTCAAIADRTARTARKATARRVFVRAAADRLAQARTAELARGLEGDRRRSAARADRLRGLRPQVGRRRRRAWSTGRRAAASSSSPTCSPSSSAPACATPSGSPPTCTTPPRTTTIRTRRCSRTSSRSGSSSPARSTPAASVRTSSTTPSARSSCT